jgi:hypothetical protein
MGHRGIVASCIAKLWAFTRRLRLGIFYARGYGETRPARGRIPRAGRWSRRKKNGPSTIPSLPNGPEVLFFSPKVEDIPN